MPRFTNLSNRQIKIFTTISIINTCNAFCFALQAPFFPAVAEKKGVSASEYGFIFGIFQFVIFAISPVFGSYITLIGSKCMMVSGVFTTGCSCVVFGSLYFIESKSIFLSLSFVTRMFEALGCAACNTASFSIVAKEFPDSIGYAMATLETFFGIGLIIGPTVGGALYELGGYIAPFSILGSCLVICSLFTGFHLPKTDLEEVPESNASTFKILKIPEIFLSMVATFSAATNIGFLQATLEPHIRFMNLSPVLLGVVFIISGLVYALIAPVWGKLCDKGISSLLLSVFGAMFIVDAFHLLGPAPYVPYEPTFRMIILALVLNGIGTGGELIPSFSGAQNFAIEAGFPQNMKTLGTVSGLWTSTFALGAFLGPTIGGLMKDRYGFRNATLYIILLHSMLILISVVFLCYRKFNLKKVEVPHDNMEGNLLKNSLESEYDKLINSENSSYGSVGSTVIVVN